MKNGNRLKVALALARQKIPVFPYELRGVNKVPVIERWNTDGASTDPKMILAWFGNGSDYRVGVPTGRLSGIDILDSDPRNGSDAWEAQYGSILPATQTHTTLQGGKHRLLKHVEGVAASKLAPGIDVLGDNGFAAWWPAEGYTVDNPGVIAEWPPELLALLRKKDLDDTPTQPLSERLPPSGMRWPHCSAACPTRQSAIATLMSR
jgi:bifunctional DNA primase/polymerase-like protein